MKANRLEKNGYVKNNGANTMSLEENESPVRIVRNWKRPEDRLPAKRDPTKVVVSPITGELIPINDMSEHVRISLIDPKYKEQKERMFAKIRDTTLAPDDEVTRNIAGLARTRPDIFGTVEEEVSDAVRADIETKKDDQPKQVIWDGHKGSISLTASQALSQAAGEDPNEANINTRIHPGPAAPPRPALVAPPPHRPPVVNMLPSVWPPLHMNMVPGQQPVMVNRPPMPQNMPINALVPPPPGLQFTKLGVLRPFVHLHMSQQCMPMNLQSHMPQGIRPAPTLPEEPGQKRQKLHDSALMPEDEFLAQYPGPARVNVSVPNFGEGSMKGQVLEITMQSLSETISSLKGKIAGKIQLPGNKQKLSGKAGFLKDNLSLAYYNVSPEETLALSLRERGGRKR